MENHDHHGHHGHAHSSSDIAANVTASLVKNVTSVLKNVGEALVNSSSSSSDDFGLFFPPSDSDTLTGMNADEHAHHQHHGGAHQHHQQAEVAHDHGGHDMKMWFHGGFTEIILFDFWKIDSFSGLLLSCVLIFVMAAGYEGLKWFRVYLQVAAKRRSERSTPLLNGHHHTGSDVYSPTTTPPVVSVRGRNSPLLSRANKASPFAASRLIDAALYIIQLTMAYWLMLIAMTYNIYLTAAVVLGAGFGHWLFAVMECMNADSDHADAFTSDACH